MILSIRQGELPNFSFKDVKNLVGVTIPDTVTSVGNGVFTGCIGMADEEGFIIDAGVLYGYVGNNSEITIPKSVTCIEDGAFDGCSELSGIAQIKIPSSVTSIGEHAFEGCFLSYIDIPDSVTSIEENAFFGCSDLKTVNFRGTKEQWDAISIADEGNEYLKNATINFTREGL